MDDDLSVAGGAGGAAGRDPRGQQAAGRRTVRGAGAARWLSARAMLDVLGLDPLSPTWAGGRARASDLHGVVDALVAVRSAASGPRPGRARTSPPPTGSATSSTAAGIVVEDTPAGPRWTLAEHRRRGDHLMAGNSERRGAKRNPGSKKGQTVGSGGQRRKQLKGKGPTPKADRPAEPPGAPQGHGRPPSAPRTRRGRGPAGSARRPARAARGTPGPARSGSPGATRWSRRCGPRCRRPRCTSPSGSTPTTGCASRSSWPASSASR